MREELVRQAPFLRSAFVYYSMMGMALSEWEGGNCRAAKGRTETLGLRRARLVAATESNERGGGGCG